MVFTLMNFQIFELLNGDEAKGILLVVVIIVSLYFFIRYLIKVFFVPKRKAKIFNDITTIFKGKINYQGYPEFQFNNRNITIEYDFATETRGYEYIIALIDISDIDLLIRKKLNSKFDLIEKNNKFYIEIYSSWGYQGIKFKERLNEKIESLNSELNKHKAKRNNIG